MVENRSSWWLPMLWRDSINVRIDIQTRLSHGIALHNICSLSSPSCLRRPGDHSESCWSSMVEVIKCERDGISKIRARQSTRLHERSTMVAVATRNSRRCGQEVVPQILPASRARARYQSIDLKKVDNFNYRCTSEGAQGQAEMSVFGSPKCLEASP